MLKMFATQLTGAFKRLQEKEEETIEDSARLLAQALVGEGTIYIYGENEMSAVVAEAINGAEPLTHAAPLTNFDEIQSIKANDRVLLVSRSSTDAYLIELAQALHQQHIPFVVIATMDPQSEEVRELADVCIDLKLAKALLPDEEGNRFGYPSSMLALFVYFGIRFIMEEFIKDYDL